MNTNKFIYYNIGDNMKNIDILRDLYIALEKYDMEHISNYLFIKVMNNGIAIKIYDYMKLKSYEVMKLNNYEDLQIIMKHYNYRF